MLYKGDYDYYVSMKPSLRDMNKKKPALQIVLKK